MKAVELYKRLPRTNCGQCGQRTCFPFALSVVRGQSSLSDCPSLSSEEIAALGDSVADSDWREDLIAQLRTEVRRLDLGHVAEGIGAAWDGERLRIVCLGREFSITPDGEVGARENLTPWMKILLLHYVRMQGKTPLTGRWVSFSELKSGMVKATSFRRDCEEPLRELLDAEPEAAATGISRMGAVRTEGFPSDLAWTVHLLPRLPAAILYWKGDEEFPSSLKILFDETADRFLDVETLIFLAEGMIRTIERSVGAD